jgi:acetyltransferase
MSAQDIGTLFSARYIVLAARGASESTAFEAALRSHGYAGTIALLSDGRAAPPGTAPIGVVLWPRLDGEAVLVALKASGCRTVVLLGPAASGGADAARARSRLRHFARRLAIRLIGPSRLGVISPARGLSISFWSPPPRQGTVGVLTRSDSIAAAILAAMERESVGLSHLVSLGEGDEVEVADILDGFALDPMTRAILLHIDRVSSPRALLSALRAASRTKPVVALRTGAAFDAPPVGATPLSQLANHHKVVEAALARGGAVTVDSLEAMADLAEILGVGKPFGMSDPSARPRLAIVSNGSAPAAIAADLAIAQGARLVPASDDPASPFAPLDLGAEAEAVDYEAAVERLIATRAADVVVVLRWPTPGGEPGAFADAIAALAARRSSYRPAHIVVGLLGGERDRAAQVILRENGVPAYETPERAVAAALGEIAHVRRKAALTRLAAPLAEELRGWIPSLAGWAATRLEGRSEPLLVDGETARPLLDTLEIVTWTGSATDTGSTALTFGIARDAVFGPVVVIAPATRLAPDSPSAIALPPLDETLARFALSRLRLGRVLIDDEPEAAAAVLSRLVMIAEVASEVPVIRELMIENVRFTAGRLEAASVSLVLDPAYLGAEPGAGMALPRYPRELEAVVTARNGRRVLMRPIRPEDARGLQRLFGKMTPEDRRMRLFVPVRELADALAARLSQIDYAREMCFVIEAPDEPGELVAGARIVCDPDGVEAEYAVSVRSDCKGMGFGRLVLGSVLDYARTRGVKKVWGSVLADNHGMLDLASRLGMRRERSPDDPDVVHTVIEFE